MTLHVACSSNALRSDIMLHVVASLTGIKQLELAGAAPSVKTAASDFRSCRQSHCDYDGTDDTATNMSSSFSDPLLASTLTTAATASATTATSGGKKRVSYGDSGSEQHGGKNSYQVSGMANVDETDEAGEHSDDDNEDNFESDSDATASTVSHSSTSLRGAATATASASASASVSQTSLQQAAAAASAAGSTGSVSTLPAIDTIRLSSPTVTTVATAQRRRSSCVQRPVGGTRIGGEQLAKLVNEAPDGDTMVEKYTRYRRSFCAPATSASSSGSSAVPLLQLLRAESQAELRAAELDAADSSTGAALDTAASLMTA
jgi:hypothetical protein